MVDANAKSIASLASTSKWIPLWRTEAIATMNYKFQKTVFEITNFEITFYYT